MGLYCLTGTPGTGKKTLSGPVATALGVKSLSINEIAKEKGLITRGKVNIPLLKKEIEVLQKALLFGHLVPQVIDKDMVERVVVLRCEPMELKRRLIERGYGTRKTKENVEAELIGVISYNCYGKYGSDLVAEYDNTSRNIESAVKEITQIFQGKKTRRIDWLQYYDSSDKLRLLLSS